MVDGMNKAVEQARRDRRIAHQEQEAQAGMEQYLKEREARVAGKLMLGSYTAS